MQPPLPFRGICLVAHLSDAGLKHGVSIPSAYPGFSKKHLHDMGIK